MLPFPLQVFDKLVSQVGVGQLIFATFALTTVAMLPLRSRRLLAANTVVFGLVLTMTPTSVAAQRYRFVGLGLLLVGPMLLATGR